MRKHFIITLAIFIGLVALYGLWLYGEGLRTGAQFGRLLERDLNVKQRAISQWWSGLRQD